jgi:hypothetical protein
VSSTASLPLPIASKSPSITLQSPSTL